MLTGGSSRMDVAVSFFTSTEYRTNLVDAYYETYLSRAPESAALAGWLNLLAQGVTDQEMLAAISARLRDSVSGLSAGL